MSFADGCKGLIPFDEIPEIKERSAVSRLSLPNPYEMVLETKRGERIELPWDFARHYCDATYRPTVEAIAMRGRQTLGKRIRHLRETAGMTQQALASAAEIGRVTLVRIESGETDAEVRDPERNRARSGKNRRRVANGSGVAIVMVGSDGCSGPAQAGEDLGGDRGRVAGLARWPRRYNRGDAGGGLAKSSPG